MLWTAFFPPLLTIIAPFYNIFFFFFQSLIDESLVEIMDNCLKRQIFWKFIVKGDTNLFLYPRKPPAQTIRGFIAVIVRRLVFDWSQEERKKKLQKLFHPRFEEKQKNYSFQKSGVIWKHHFDRCRTYASSSNTCSVSPTPLSFDCF